MQQSLLAQLFTWLANVQWFFLLYFIAINLVYLLLNVVSILYIRRYTQERDLDEIPPFYSAFAPPVSLLVPAYNEETTIVASLRSMFQIIYPEYDVIVINDGSKDRTMQVLIEAFDLVPLPDAYTTSLRTQKIKAVYLSTRYHWLRVIDKENGGKADSLNAGINISNNALVCCVDADSILQSDSLIRVVQPFMEEPATIACGGTIRIANGCVMEGSTVSQVRLPRHPLALIQVVEYLRAFLFGRLGWSPLNALLIISGAFSVFRRDAVIAVGGYCTHTVGEDMELVVRLHRHYRLNQLPYRITFVPDPICWTDVPEDIKTLRNQRTRWQRGLAESLWLNRQLLLHPKSGLVGWLAFPFMLLFEMLSPWIELAGYVFMVLGLLGGFVSPVAFSAFLLVSVGLGLLLSVNALLLEEMSFHLYARATDTLRLLAALLVENLGYRQMTLCWRATGLFQWLFRRKANWGAMKRTSGLATPSAGVNSTGR
ncbi:MAG: glycosyltransferase [Candidatus Melainabacteria bacterium]|nr:glycosyltransferase [Candidatus Melainabacteria bacterium]